ncbi:MAG: hypothetical protein KF902_06300 [Phycisphaeraceae bacterium]|nr:hypothetical protein [Phycisphaeraceae bacterium]QYK48980.1 MAG: hypothetical protein KF838_03805 [Phycisphaeraceae bacterium]
MRATLGVLSLSFCVSLSAQAQNNWVQNNPNIFFTGGNVGIGTNGPVHRLSVQSGTDRAVGIYVENSTITGDPTYGLWAQSLHTTGRGVYGRAVAETGANIGVLGVTRSSTGHGVYGSASETSGVNFGVRGVTDSPLGFGVRGVAGATGVGVNAVGVHGRSSGQSGRGVYGEANSADGTTYGVIGYTTSASGYAVYADGALAASGTKTFVIDHPQDPENRLLLHYSAEGPEPYLVYRGTVTLDDAGVAQVALPHYFDQVARDPQYQLTPVGAPSPSLHVARKVSEGTFAIGGGVPGLEVCWTVTAVRNDLWVRANPPATEKMKPDHERGTYLRPELYGQPATRRTHYISPEEPILDGL